MKRHTIAIALVQTLVLLAVRAASPFAAETAPARSAVKPLPRLAVVAAVPESDGQDRQNMEDLLMVELGNQPFLQLVDRQALARVMQEHAIALGNQADTKGAIALGKFAGADYLLYVLVANDEDPSARRKALVRLVEVASGQVRVDNQVALSKDLALSMAAVREQVLAAVRPDSQAVNRLTVGIAQFPNRSGTGRSDKLGVELQKALRKRLSQEAWAVVLEREYPKALLDELELGRAGLVRSSAAEKLPPADLVISGSTDDVSRVYQPDRPWEVRLDLSLRLRGRLSQASQVFRSDAIELAAEEALQTIARLRRQPASPLAVPEKELWRRQGLYLMPPGHLVKRAHLAHGELSPDFPQMSELNQRELIRTWQNVLLLDGNDPDAMTYLGVCLVGCSRKWPRYYEWNVAQCIAGTRLIERALEIEPTRARAATYYRCLQLFVSERVSAGLAREMAQYTLDHPERFAGIHDGASVKRALTGPAETTDIKDLGRLAAALANADKDPAAVLILFPPGLARRGPVEPYVRFLTPYLESPNPVVQFAVRRAMGVLLCWVEKDPAGLDHLDKSIALMEAAQGRCRNSAFGYTFDDIYRLRIEACEYLGLPEEARKTAWAGARHFMRLGRFDNNSPSAVGRVYEFCVTKAIGAGQEREALEICDAYLASAKEMWPRHEGWPRVCAKREELLSRLAGRSPPDMSGLRLVIDAEALKQPDGHDLMAMRMTSAAGKLWFVPLGQTESYGMVYDPARHEFAVVGTYGVRSVAATTDRVFFGGSYGGLSAYDTSGKLLKRYEAKGGLFPGSQIDDLCAGGGKIYVAFRGPPQAGIAVLDPATDQVSILAPSSRDAKREQEPTEPMHRLQWDSVTPRLYAARYETSFFRNRLLLMCGLYGWSPQRKTWQRYPLEQAPRSVVSDGSETLVVRWTGKQTEFHFVKADQTVSAALPLPSLMGEPAWDGQRIWVPTASGLYEVDRATGRIQWLAYQNDNPFLSVLKTDDRLYVATSRGLYCHGGPASMPARNEPIRNDRKRMVVGKGPGGPAPAVKGSVKATWFSAGPGWRGLSNVVTAGGIQLASFNHGAGPYQTILSRSRPGSTIVLLFALDNSDKDVPAEYSDLLPVPWPQIEASLKGGEVVETAGRSRERRIVLLAAPTESELQALIGRTGLLRQAQ